MSAELFFILRISRAMAAVTMAVVLMMLTSATVLARDIVDRINPRHSMILGWCVRQYWIPE